MFTLSLHHFSLFIIPSVCLLVYMEHNSSFRCLAPTLVSISLSQMSDRGGGVPFRKIERLFSYMYSTAPRPSISDKHRAPLVRDWHTHMTKNAQYDHRNGANVCVCTVCLHAGRVRVRSAHLPALRSLFPGRLAALLHGGKWNWCHHPPEGMIEASNGHIWNVLLNDLFLKSH